MMDFFRNYKNLQNKKVEINGIGDFEEAQEELKLCRERYQKLKPLVLANDKAKLMAALESKSFLK